jgi:hypothetical protein
MPIDYRIPYEIGSQKSRIIDPATLAGLREKVAARQQEQLLANQKYEADQQEMQRANMLRQLLPKAVTVDQTGAAVLVPEVANEYLALDGSAQDLKTLLDLRGGSAGSQFAATMTPAIDVATGEPVFIQPTKQGGAIPVPGFRPMRETPAQAAQKEKDKALTRLDDRKVDIELKLAKEYETQSADFQTIQQQADLIQRSLNDPSAAATLASATALMKLLDPGSVVRESELGMAMKATGKIDQLTNYFNVVENGQVLTPDQKKEFSRLVKQFVGAAAEAQNRRNQRFSKRAKAYGLNTENVVTINPFGPGEITIGADRVNGGAGRPAAGQKKTPAVNLDKFIPR